MLRSRAAVLLSLVALVTVVSWSSAAEHGLGLRAPTPEEQAYLRAHVRRVTAVAPNALALARAQEERARTPRAQQKGPALPTAVDNSTFSYFPPVGDQQAQNSCAAWSTTYYFETYTQAMDEGYDTSTGNPDYLCSPAFTYPLVNGGADNGAVLEFTMLQLSRSGASSWTDMPWTDTDATTWPSETAWVHALRNRTSTANAIDGSTPAGNTAIKQFLANGQLAIIGLNVYTTWYSSYPLDGNGINNGVYYATNGANVGGHALTLVGYDDGKSYVDSRDGLTHYGAFLLANQWSSLWGVTNSVGKRGFMWIAYTLFQDPNFWVGTTSSFDSSTCFNDDRPHYRPALYAVTGINEAQRGKVSLFGTVSGASTWTGTTVINIDALWATGGNALPVSDTARIAVDLTDGVGALTAGGASTVSVSLALGASASTGATITSADFYEDVDGNGVYNHVASTDPTVTIGPGASGSASAAATPGGADYEVAGASLPRGLIWGGTATATVEVRNLGAASWSSSGSYALQLTDPINRWNPPPLPLSVTVGPMATYAFSFDLTGPPATTLQYVPPATSTSVATVKSLSVGLVMAHLGTPLSGQTASEEVVVSRFVDDQPSTVGAWARTQIEECAGRVPAIVGGYSDGTYRPRVTVTRDQMAVFIQRSLGLPLLPYVGHFPDVDSSNWAYAQIEALWRAGLVSGYSDGTYRPLEVVTRAPMAMYIARGMVGSTSIPPGPPTPSFPDVPTSDIAYNSVEYLKTNSVVGGYPDGYYHPLDSVTRDQMGVFVYRAFIQPQANAVVLAGPALTAQDPATGGACGWTSSASAAAATPGYAYVAFDALRLGPALAYGGTWDVTFELRAAAAPGTPATGLYTLTYPTDVPTLTGIIATAQLTGDPYYVVPWTIPAGLTPGDYILVVSVEDAAGNPHEIARKPAFTITP